MLLFLSGQVFGQVGGSSSPLLMNPPAAQEGFAQGRYQIKKVERSKTIENQSMNKTRAPANTGPVEEIKPAPAPTPTVEKAEELDVKEPTISEQAQGLVNEDSRKVIEAYKEQIHPDDIRNNQLEIQVSPALVYNGSSSNYSYRSYSSFFTALDLDSTVWMSPSIGINGRLMFSFGATLSGDSATSSRALAKYEDMDLGIKFRRFFGMSRMANSLEFNFLHNESRMKVSSDNQHRPSLISSGIGLKMSSRIPTSSTFAWVFGGSFFPRLQHKEEKTGIDVRSGSSGENTRFGIDLGGEVKFSRESQFTYDFSVITEKNTFDGLASPVDPETKAAPTNVSVTNSSVMFSFGYRWGR